MPKNARRSRSPQSLPLGTWLSLFGCVLQVPAALGAGFAIRNQSASSSGTSLAADGVNISDATGMFANPAIISELKGQHVSLNIDYLMAGIKMKDAELTNTYPNGSVVPHPNPGRTDFNEVSEPAAIPALFGSHQLNDEFHVGWALSVPWATNVKYDEEWVGRYHAVNTELTVMELALNGSYKINEQYNVALGLLLQNATGKISSATDLGLILASQNPSNASAIGRLDAISEYKADHNGLGIQLGLLAKPLPNLRVGLAHRSAIKHETQGKLKFRTNSPQAAGALQNFAAANSAFQEDDNAKLDLTIPSVTTLGVAYGWDAYTFYGNLAYTTWSSFEEFKIRYSETSSTIELDWKNSLFVALGADYQLNENLILRAGLSHDQGVASDERRTPRTPDTDRTALAIGAGYKLSDLVKLNAAYQKLFMEDAKVDLSDQDYPDAALRGNLKSTFEFNPNIFVVSADFAF